MDAQLKRGMLDACILACLEKGDSYGYQLIKEISPVVEISESTLYPILKRLESAKSLATYSKEFEGRLRKYYSITDIGKKKITDFLEDFKSIDSIYAFVKNSTKEINQ